MEMATTQPPTRKFLQSLEGAGQREQAELALADAAAAALAEGAIQLAVGVVVAKV